MSILLTSGFHLNASKIILSFFRQRIEVLFSSFTDIYETARARLFDIHGEGWGMNDKPKEHCIGG